MKLIHSYCGILLLLIIAGCGSKSIILSEDQITNDIYYLADAQKPYTGECIVYYTNSKIVHHVFHFQKGLLNGEYICYFKNGKIEYSGSYKQSEMDGKWARYDENGKLLFRGYYSKGELAMNIR